MNMKAIRVLIVDDSAFMRKIISQILSSDPLIDVVGTSKDGLDALEKIKEFQPDVITLDVEMPRMNGIEMLEELMKTNPKPIVMVSSLTQTGSNITIRALELGAVDFITKPSGTISLDINKVGDELIEKVKIASKALIKTPIKFGDEKPSLPLKQDTISKLLVIIGVSTGGPQALCKIFSNLEPSLAASFIVVQHMPPIFTKALAERLNKLSYFMVKEAEDNDALVEGSVFVAKGGYHLDIRTTGIIRLSNAPPVKSVRPAIDVTMSAAAKTYGKNVLGVILTGMGSDGTYGMCKIKEAGGYTLAEAESSCIVYGMSRSVIENNCADEILDIKDIPARISNLVRKYSAVGTEIT